MESAVNVGGAAKTQFTKQLKEWQNDPYRIRVTSQKWQTQLGVNL